MLSAPRQGNANPEIPVSEPRGIRGSVDDWLPENVNLEELHRFNCGPGLEDKESVFPEPLDVCATCNKIRLEHKYQYSLSAVPTFAWTYQLARNVQLLEWRRETK